MKTDFYQDLQTKFNSLVKENNLLNEKISVEGKPLTVEEAIGNPKRKDFPLVKGKEKLMQATFKGNIGQAFTDMPGNFEGTLEEIINRPLNTNFDMAVYISTINAVMKYLGLIEGTIHCKDEEPECCADKLPEFFKTNYGNPRIALVGFQPSFLEKLSSFFQVRVLDLDADRIDTKKYGVLIENGEKNTQDVLNWCDIIFATGSTIVNKTIIDFINLEKPVIFYGTTIAGAAELLNLKRFCKYSK